MLKALIFDFDGLIIDTETPDYQSWSDIYDEHGATLSREKWSSHVGSWGTFNPYQYLEDQIGHPVDRQALRTIRRKRYSELVAQQPILPGVIEMIEQAKADSLKLGVASNSFDKWVVTHLKDRGLYDYFDTVVSLDQITVGKPEPKMYLATLALLEVGANEALAFEDSPTGAMGAKRANIYTIAIPNEMTHQANFSHCDQVVRSMADIDFKQLKQHFNQTSASSHSS